MATRYLEVTYRLGKPLAAYLYMPRRPADTSAKVLSVAPALKADIAGDGRLIGIEILDPGHISLEALNQVLAKFSQPPLTMEELRPLGTAA